MFRLSLLLLLFALFSCKRVSNKPIEIQTKEIDMATVAYHDNSREESSVKLGLKKFYSALIKKDAVQIRKFLKENLYYAVTTDGEIYPKPYIMMTRAYFINHYMDTITSKNYMNAMLRYKPDINTGDSLRGTSIKPDYCVTFIKYDTVGYERFRTLYNWYIDIESSKISITGLGAEFDGREICSRIKDYKEMYFPLKNRFKDSLYNEAAIDTFTDIWYTNDLKHLKEQAIMGNPEVDDIFRFTWLRSFDAPVSITLQKTGNEWQLTSRILQYAGNYLPYHVKMISKKPGAIESYQIYRLFNNIDFEHLPTIDKNEDSGHDGSEWIYEMKYKGRYHFTSRWSSGFGRYRQIGKLLINISGLNIPEKEVY